MNLRGEWIEAPQVQQCCAMIETAGYRAYLVGGCVRNALLEAPINDIDVATDATPETVLELAKANKIRAVATGIEHGTVTVVINGAPVEVTTFRRDVETDGRRAVVSFSTDIVDDARRRDFTINALYATSQGKVIDPLGGLSDLRARRVRFIEDADQRIKEDYLRILRFFRFYAWYGDKDEGLDSDGLAACAANLAGLETLAKERVGSELLKLLAADDPSRAVAAMAQSGVLSSILAGAESKMLPVLVHNELQHSTPPDAIRRLAILGAENARRDLRLSNEQVKVYDILRSEMAELTTAAALAYRFGSKAALSILLLRETLFETSVSKSDIAALADGAKAKFPVKAADLMPALEGPALGTALRDLETRWIDSGFTLSRQDLLDLYS